MATIWELAKSREADLGVENSSRALYLGAGPSEDEDEIEALVEAFAPAFWKGLAFHSYKIVHLGGGMWEAEVRYTTRQPKEIGQSSFSFDTTGGTAKITQALTTAMNVIGDNTPPQLPDLDDLKIDNHGAINVHDGKVEGVEIVIPQFSFTVTRVIADPLPTAYAASLETLTGRVNLDVVVINISGVIYTFQNGELLFMGASGGKRGTDAWEITLRFEVSRNATLDIGEILNIQKYGHDYLWVIYEKVEDGKAVTPKPKQVNCEQVYKTAELSPLFA